jgi:hypothetical protein
MKNRWATDSKGEIQPKVYGNRHSLLSGLDNVSVFLPKTCSKLIHTLAMMLMPFPC